MPLVMAHSAIPGLRRKKQENSQKLEAKLGLHSNFQAKEYQVDPVSKGKRKHSGRKREPNMWVDGKCAKIRMKKDGERSSVKKLTKQEGKEKEYILSTDGETSENTLQGLKWSRA